MSEYIKSTRRQQKIISFIVGISMILGFILPYTELYLGFALGGLVGLYNHWLLQRRINDLGEAVSRGEKPSGLGVFSRLAASAAGTMIVLILPTTFHLVTFVIGLFISYIVMYVDFLLNDFQRQEKVGEANESHSSDC